MYSLFFFALLFFSILDLGFKAGILDYSISEMKAHKK